MTPEEDGGFTFVDKRRADADEESAAETAPSDSERPAPAADVEAPAPEPGAGEADEPLPHLTIYDRMMMCIDIMRQGAWIAMGLIVDPNTGQIEKDLDEARTAIDSVDFLVKQVEAQLDAETRHEVKRWVSDLQVNFVQQLHR